MGLRPFEDIVIAHGPAVLRVCRSLLGYHEAEDAWAETFLAALKAYPDLDPEANVEAWLITIAKHKAIDQHRSAGRNPRPVEEVPETIGSNRVTIEEVDELCTALRSLPGKQREVVAYHHLGGLPYAEVASIVGGTEWAARRAGADGIKNLRARYEGAPRQ
ncbi:MAG TPA: sigma-70 family RNA polymerase sigma factor [Acidimicrobiales bacterium]|nr:sigma-70 family RNA polymerase sigma factor [Acidimicrobiales bacterium]